MATEHILVAVLSLQYIYVAVIFVIDIAKFVVFDNILLGLAFFFVVIRKSNSYALEGYLKAMRNAVLQTITITMASHE